jgi:hypothetical protein
MNRNLDFAYAADQWFVQHPDSAPPRSDLKVPFICELMPMRWSYEAIIFAQAKLNPLTRRQDIIQKKIAALAEKKNPSEADDDRLDDLKELLALVSGLSGPTAGDVDRSLGYIDQVIAGGPYDSKAIQPHSGRITADQLYTNTKVTDLVSKAEMEQFDYRAGKQQNVFFGPIKQYFGIRVSVLTFNICVLVASIFACLFALNFILRYQIGVRGP